MGYIGRPRQAVNQSIHQSLIPAQSVCPPGSQSVSQGSIKINENLKVANEYLVTVDQATQIQDNILGKHYG